MKIMIIGCGKIGATLAAQLNEEGHEITLVDSNSAVLQQLTNSLDVMGVVGNGANHQVQLEAGVDQADLLIAATNSDELNLLCCLVGTRSGHCQTIARVRNPEYTLQMDLIKADLGLSMHINPEFASAMEAARLLRFPSAIEIDTFAKGRVEMQKVAIPEDSPLCGHSIQDSMTRLKSRVLICAVERGNQVVIPDGSFYLQAGDKISIIASLEHSAAFYRQVGIPAEWRVRSVMIVGGGKIAYYLARKLLKDGFQVKIVERDARRCDFLCENLPGAMIIHGDGSNQELLLEEGIDHVDAFASFTDFDEENILLSLFAGIRSPHAKLITKINRISFGELVDTFPLGSIICPKFITAEQILQYVRAMQNSMGSNVETLYRILGGRAEALEFRVQKGSPVAGIPLQNLPLKDELLVCSIRRGGKVFTPGGRDTLEVEDRVIIVTTHTGLEDLQDIVK